MQDQDPVFETRTQKTINFSYLTPYNSWVQGHNQSQIQLQNKMQVPTDMNGQIVADAQVQTSGMEVSLQCSSKKMSTNPHTPKNRNCRKKRAKFSPNLLNYCEGGKNSQTNSSTSDTNNKENCLSHLNNDPGILKKLTTMKSIFEG